MRSRLVSVLRGGASGVALSLAFSNMSSGAELAAKGVTFTRAGLATQFDSTGKLTWAPNNLLTNSGDLSGGGWVGNGSANTAGQADPFGGTTAQLQIPSTSAGNKYNLQNIARATRTMLSVYAKAAGYNWVMLDPGFGSGARAWFNLATGTIGTSLGGGNPSILSVGNGWYRLSISSPGVDTGFGGYWVTAGDVADSMTGDGVSGVLFCGSQLEAVTYQTAPRPYVATTSAAYYGPRFDYDPVTLQPKGLLLEESRTNSLPNSMMAGAAAGSPGTPPTGWASANTTSGVTRAIAATGVVNGMPYVDLRISGTNALASTNFLDWQMQNTSAQTAYTAGQVWSGSFWIQLIAGALPNNSHGRVNIGEFSSTGAFIAANANTSFVPDGTLRRTEIQRTTTDATAGNGLRLYVGLPIPANATVDFTLRIAGPQLELGAFATSLIPTSGTAVTRAAETATMTGAAFSSWFNANAGTFVVDHMQVAPLTAAGIFSLEPVSAGSYASVKSDGGVSWYGSQFSVGAETLGTSNKTAIAYTGTNMDGVRNGGTVSTSAASDFTGTSTALVIGSANSNYSNGWIKSLTYYRTRKTNAQLQALTA